MKGLSIEQAAAGAFCDSLSIPISYSLLSAACLRQKESYLLFSQVWFPTVQLVLHADWQDV